ncbi:ankyrin repeat-containing protein BDA1-like isoform X4 [Benincasa hispida]|uniref:ankyrin repeat-containing protein BDA1-like isoform X4 n=1 Tax=Benincasa hispida TaxID=102211 RepID=UPI001901BCEB|nr:ankyrin repeat-containing protein BDA1-like isoform X4 [Benincasa hispida]XP_038886834.1 ankyrin repeat-containing protein BDA1-like isoform X4 [Benincasa hispida]
MDERLKAAATSGDIKSLYSIIGEDAYVLDCIDKVPFVDSPLHISASNGHVHFSLEMMRLKPSLAKKLNPKGYSPIHLAMKNDRTETVFRLADVDRDLVTLHGKKGLTPLHIAASKGKDKFLAKFLISYPESIKGLTDREESALHIAVKKDKIGALGILLEWTKQANMNSILNWSDDEGNNIMHVAALEGNNIMHLTATEGNNIRNLETLENKVKMVKLLLSYKVDIKSKNLEGLTAMDILRRVSAGIEN